MSRPVEDRILAGDPDPLHVDEIDVAGEPWVDPGIQRFHRLRSQPKLLSPAERFMLGLGIALATVAVAIFTIGLPATTIFAIGMGWMLIVQQAWRWELPFRG